MVFKAGAVPRIDADGHLPDDLIDVLVDDLEAAGIGGGLSKAEADATYAPVTGTLNPRGAWAGNTAYAVGDYVLIEAGAFRAIAAHTSNNAGFRYDREKWAPLDIAALHSGTTVPVRQLQFTSPGASSESPPLAGLFQHRPKQCDYSGERVAWYFDDAADLTASGTGIPTLATGATIGGSVVITSHTSSTSPGYAQAAVLAAPIDLTSAHLRIPIKVTGVTGRFLSLQLTSAGTDFTNRLNVNVMAGSTDNTPQGEHRMISIAPQEMTVVGTGVNLAAVNGARFMTENGSGGQFTVEVSKIAVQPNLSDKGKVVLWFDDGTFASHRTAIKIAATYGLPVTLSPVGENLVATGAQITVDEARYVQDVLRGQITVHAFAAADHNRVQTGKTLMEQLLSWQHFGLAAGLHGVMDGAFWSTGNTGDDAAARHIVRRLFRSMRGGRSRLIETLPPGDPTFTRALMTGAGNTSTGHYQPFATRAANAKGLAQFVWHDMSAGDLTEFTTFCAWLDANRATLEVTTIAGALDPISR